MQSIRSKLQLSFLAIILLPVLTLGVLGPLMYSRAIERDTTNHTEQMLHQITRNLEFYVRDMENIIFYLSKDPQINRFLEAGGASFSQSWSAADTVLATYADAHPEIAGILVVNPNDEILSNEFQRVARDPLSGEDWYRRAVQSPGAIQLYPRPIGRNIRNVLQYSAEEVVSIVKAVVDPQSGRQKGVILIDLKLGVVDDIFTNTTLGESGFIYIVDAAGNIVYAPVNKTVYRVRFEWLEGPRRTAVRRIRGVDYQLIHEDSAYTGWKTVGVFSTNDILRQVNDIRYFSMIIGAVTAILAFAVSWFFTTSISRPVIQLRELMGRVEEGDLAIRFQDRSTDEIGQLGNSFNTMVDKIRELIQIVYHEQQSKREAELKILHQQIKPHFLYNTLDTIQWMAEERGAQDIVKLVGALTKLFRISLSRGKEMIPLSEEIAHVQSYLVIQKARYEDKFDFEITVDQALLKYQVLKMTLQPLVENAIYHGIKESRRPGTVGVKILKEGELLLMKVIDDGIGMTDETLNRLRETLAKRTEGEGSSGGYAVYNVNERIQLSFGSRYGVRIESSYGIGTTVEVRHPLIHEEENHHVANTDRR